MNTYNFEATIKSIVSNGEVEFHIVPTSKYVIKDPNGETHYVAFDATNKSVRLLKFC